MTGWGGLWKVAAREVRERGRSRAFLLSSALTMLLIAGIIVVPQLVGGEPATHKVGSVGNGNDQIVAAAAALAEAEAEDPDEAPSFVTTTFPDEDTARQALERRDVDVVLVDGEKLIRSNQGFFSGPGLVGLLQRAAGSLRLQQLLAEDAGVGDVIAILSSDPLAVSSLSGDDAANDVRPVIAYAGLILMYIAVLSYGTWTLTGVTEETSNRVVEVLLATLRPWQLLGGKVLGIGLLGMVQFLLTLAIAFVAIRATGLVDLPDLPLNSVVVLFVWFVLGFALYAVSFGAAGALVSRPEEAQSSSFPLTMVAVVGFFVSFRVLDQPDSTLARFASFFPFTAPYVVPIRNSLDAIGPLEHLAAVAAMVLGIGLLVRGAARVYRGGVLRSGARVKLREAWKGAGD
jgi:ABC-2 type transport system permease protein